MTHPAFSNISQSETELSRFDVWEDAEGDGDFTAAAMSEGLIASQREKKVFII